MNVNPTKDAEVFDNADDELANSGLLLFALSCTPYCTD